MRWGEGVVGGNTEPVIPCDVLFYSLPPPPPHGRLFITKRRRDSKSITRIRPPRTTTIFWYLHGARTGLLNIGGSSLRSYDGDIVGRTPWPVRVTYIPMSRTPAGRVIGQRRYPDVWLRHSAFVLEKKPDAVVVSDRRALPEIGTVCRQRKKIVCVLPGKG